MGPLVLLALVGHGTPDLSPVALLRATLAAARHLPDAAVVAVPLASHGDAEIDHALGLQVATNYAGPNPVLGLPATRGPATTPTTSPRSSTSTSRRPTARAWCCSSPASPAAASRRWPAR